MTLTEALSRALASGVHRIGQIEIQTIDSNLPRFALTHADEAAKVAEPDFGGLAVYRQADDAHALATFGDDDEYRFSKARTNLARGWVLIVEGIEELRRALDLFYPAALGVWTAERAPPRARPARTCRDVSARRGPRRARADLPSPRPDRARLPP